MNKWEQFFLQDQKVVEKIATLLELRPKDKVLEIGAGKGEITRKLSETGATVLAVEIDSAFKQELIKIPGKVQVIIADALKVLKRKVYPNICFNKITGSLPSTIVEPLIHLLTKTDFELAVFLFPLKFAYKILNHPVFTAFFEIEIVEKVSRKSFWPIPRTNWAIVKIKKKPNPLATKEEERFLKQYLYFHPKAKKINALAEGLIQFWSYHGKLLTKKEAKKLATKNPLW